MKKVVNVFKKNTKTYEPSGFGDYLRGCVYLALLSEKMGFELEFDVSHHPISEYIVTNSTDFTRTLEDQNNVEEFIIWWLKPAKSVEKYITAELEKHDVLYIYVTDPYHNFWHTSMISSVNARDYVAKNIIPTNEIMSKVESIINNFELTQFNILHVRTGDGVLNENKQWNIPEYLNPSLLNNKYNINENNTIILSDSIAVKKYFRDNNFKTTDILPAHSGICKDNIEGSIIEFYLMACAKSIYSVSSYFWGSTFSTMCSAIYNIPLFKIPENSESELKDMHIKYCKSCDWQ